MIPYTYMIGWSSLNLWYYGRRTAKDCHPNELWKTYFTSSKYVSKTRKDLGEPDIVQVRKIFDNVLECCEWEVTVLRRLKVLTSDKWLNKAVGSTWINNPCSGEFNGFYGKKHTQENLKRAVDTRRKNGNGDYFQGKDNPLKSENVLKINKERMIKDNPMFDPEIKQRSSIKSRETQKSFSFWFEQYFKRNENWQQILEFISEADSITPLDVSKKFNIKIYGATTMVKRIKEEYLSSSKEVTQPCPQ